MSLLRRIRDLLWNEAPAGEPPASLPGSPASPPAPLVMLPEEQELLQLIAALRSSPVTPPLVDTRRVHELVDRLVADGRIRLAIDLLRELSAVPPHLEALRLRLAELLLELQEHAEAVPLLRDLASLQAPAISPTHALRAHFLLGAHYQREGDQGRALLHYESILALDFGYPRARGRADKLMQRIDRPVATAAPTILGAPDGSSIRGGPGCATQRDGGKVAANERFHAEVVHPSLAHGTP